MLGQDYPDVQQYAPDRKILQKLTVESVSALEAPSARSMIVGVYPENTSVEVDSKIPHSKELKKLAEVRKFTGKEECFTGTWLLDSECYAGLLGVGVSDSSKIGKGVAASAVEAYYIGGQLVGAQVASEKPKELLIAFPSNLSTMEMITACLHRIFFAMTSPIKYFKKSAEPEQELERVKVYAPHIDAVVLAAVCNTAKVLAGSSLFAAGLSDLPPNYLNCQTFAHIVMQECYSRSNIQFNVMDEHDCKSRGMGAFLAVAQGSRFGARMIHLTYKKGHGENVKKFALVGKGITMDTGGYNLKPSDAITYMKFDMGGAALMCATIFALADLEIEDVEVHAVVAVCENMVSKDAYRPGDIVTASNGKTIEIQNTDAEGRLALCDALVYAEKQALQGQGGQIIDAATLTGACLVGLGLELTALYSNRDEMRSEIGAAALSVGEPMWEMPLRKRYLGKMKPDHCDYSNVKQGFRYGGSITAALFLQEFVSPETPWAHLDIAGTNWNFDKNRGTGHGVATLVNYIAKR